ERHVGAFAQLQVGVAQRQHVLIEIEDGVGVFELAGHVVSAVSVGHGQPGLAVGEAGIGAVAPLHGGALTVAPLLLGPAAAAYGILYVLAARGVVIAHPDFFAVIHDGRAPKGQVEAGQQLGNLIVVLAVAVAVVGAGNVVIAENVDRPSAGGIHAGDLFAEFGS